MKKIKYLLLLLSLSLYSIAQDNTATEEVKPKKDISEYVPQAGDIAIGVDLMPYLNFMGNMFNGTSNNTLNVGSNTIYGKYFLDSESAIRCELHITNNTTINKEYVRDDANFVTNPNAQVEDQRKTVNNYYGFGLGYQRYRGRRLRGTYGVVSSVYFGKSTIDYDWGNQMTASNIAPTSTNWNGTINPAERDIEVKSYGSFTFNVGIIGGVEYFVAKKICIGGEFGLYYSFSSFKQTYHKYQTIEQDALVEYEIADRPKNATHRITTAMYDRNNVAGRIYVLFHF